MINIAGSNTNPLPIDVHKAYMYLQI